MVIVKVKAVVLYWTEARHAKSKQRPDIGFSIFRCSQDSRSARLQDLRRRLEQCQVPCRSRHADAYRMSRTQVAFNRSKMFCGLRFVIGSIGTSAGIAKFLIHPRNHPNGAPRMQTKLLDELCRLHGHNYSRTIINGSGAKVP